MHIIHIIYIHIHYVQYIPRKNWSFIISFTPPVRLPMCIIKKVRIMMISSDNSNKKICILTITIYYIYFYIHARNNIHYNAYTIIHIIIYNNFVITNY